MRFIKVDVIRTNRIDDWWRKVHHPLVDNVLFVNEAKAPKRHFQLKRGGTP